MASKKGKIVIAADPFGEKLKDSVVAHLRSGGYEVDDRGTGAYYDKAAEVARDVQQGGARGMLFCGTGMGVGIIANKFSGVQAATCENVAAARCSRSINDSNILCMGGLVTEPPAAAEIADAWLAQEHCAPPCAAGEAAPDWWSGDVEGFLKGKWGDIKKVEEQSRAH
mmetsp:Transcript_3401/g.9980  ORF Transcript_3401/g.9980 Transcript_3401/m.9980 type:complete len:168 (-) Transcript_3401:30-533(-)